MKKAIDRHVVSFQSEPFHKGRRYHWMICWDSLPTSCCLGDMPLPRGWLSKRHRTNSRTSLRGWLKVDR